jgi:integrase
MAKYQIKVSTGRQTVKPFTQKEADDLRIYCKRKRDEASDKRVKESKNPHWSDKYQWDRNYMLIDLGINTALRISDLHLLKVSEQLVKGYVDVREQKTNRSKPFELNPRIAKELDAYIKRNNLIMGEFLFQSREGYNMPISTHQALNIVKETADAIGIVKKVGTHSLRKTFGKLYYEKTKDLVGLHRMIHSGKGDPTVTLIYICVLDDEVNQHRKGFDI